KVAQANDTALYENPRALPRALVVHNAVPMTDDQFYARMDDGTFDPARMAAVSSPPPADLPVGASSPSSETTSIRAADGANPNDIRVNVDLAQPGLLVISNVWYPGWSAVVDGRAQPVERVDATFQGVYLPAGSHDVRLIFAPASLRVGLALAAI